ncbi:hypothetical protein HZA33_04355 [Candidatus Pacearchaeota archaeon]|nr:hypothetical protein [Candidatus Pacearchaeota archaeon]
MNKIQKEIVKGLKETSKRLGRSLKRRDIPRLARKCYKYFGSFNKAKKKADLKMVNVRISDFSNRVFKIDKDMARIVSYLTFDGHLYKDLSGFFLSSKNIKDLENFEKLIKKKFGMRGRYYLNSGGGGKFKTHKFIIFNKKLCEELFKLGVSRGDKTTQKFNVPKWIFNSKDFSREYLKIAYFCEGSNKEEFGRTPRIQINIAKSEEILDSGLKFMNTLRIMLRKFGINTTKCYISNGRLRNRDSKKTKDIKFRIDIKDNNKFINQVGWFK